MVYLVLLRLKNPLALTTAIIYKKNKKAKK